MSEADSRILGPKTINEIEQRVAEGCQQSYEAVTDRASVVALRWAVMMSLLAACAFQSYLLLSVRPRDVLRKLEAMEAKEAEAIKPADVLQELRDFKAQVRLKSDDPYRGADAQQEWERFYQTNENLQDHRERAE